MIEKLRSRIEARQESMASLALLLVRVSAGLIFMQTGWGKLHHLADITEYFQSLGIPLAELQAPFVSAVEFTGGALLLVGLLTRLAAAPLIGTMVVALLTAKRGEVESLTDVLGFIEWHYLVFFVALLLMGPGRWSLDHLLTKRWFKTKAGTAVLEAA